MLKTMLFAKKHNRISEGCCFVYKHTVNNSHFNFYAHLCSYFRLFVMFVWIGIWQQFLPWAINSVHIVQTQVPLACFSETRFSVLFDSTRLFTKNSSSMNIFTFFPFYLEEYFLFLRSVLITGECFWKTHKNNAKCCINWS